MLDLIIEPMQFGFMQRALLVSALAAIACGVVGTFVVLRGMAFLGDAIAHSALTGMAAAFLLGVNVFLGALIWAVPASLTISAISRRAGVRIDAVIGVMFAGGFAVGIILINTSENYAGDLLGVLFGNVLGASWGDVLAVALLAGGVLLVVRLFYKELVFTTYDADVAQASGVPARFLAYLLPPTSCPDHRSGPQNRRQRDGNVAAGSARRNGRAAGAPFGQHHGRNGGGGPGCHRGGAVLVLPPEPAHRPGHRSRIRRPPSDSGRPVPAPLDVPGPPPPTTGDHETRRNPLTRNAVTRCNYNRMMQLASAIPVLTTTWRQWRTAPRHPWR